jgi:molecular chaperone DnaJ
MKLDEAYKIMGLPPNSSPDELKKQYKKLAREFHPDVNKSLAAEETLKKINEAYQIVTSGKETGEPTDGPYWNQGFDPFGRINAQPIIEHATITFAESVLGSKKELKYKRSVKCAKCNGQGAIQQHNGCDKCNGLGVLQNRNGNMFITRTCDKCQGKVPSIPCMECKMSGVVTVETQVTVSIPGGIQNNTALRISGMGNYGKFMGMDQYADVFLKITVTPQEGLSINGSYVISDINISLLEALTGCLKEVPTVLGNKSIQIPAKTKNKDEIKIPRVGINGHGDQLVIINVEYPEDASQLIDLLSKKEL